MTVNATSPKLELSEKTSSLFAVFSRRALTTRKIYPAGGVLMGEERRVGAWVFRESNLCECEREWVGRGS